MVVGKVKHRIRKEATQKRFDLEREVTVGSAEATRLDLAPIATCLSLCLLPFPSIL